MLLNQLSLSMLNAETLSVKLNASAFAFSFMPSDSKK